MAEIEIERKPRRSGWTWLALLLVLAAVAVGAYLVFNGGVEGGDAAPAAEEAPTVIEPLDGPTSDYPPTGVGEAPVGDAPVGGEEPVTVPQDGAR